jgi:hypothetical protein
MIHFVVLVDEKPIREDLLQQQIMIEEIHQN